MRTFFIGLILGASLSAIAAQAGQFYNSNGQPAAPRGSVQEFDYFRQRQQFLDIQHMRREAEQDRAAGRVPCGK